MKVSYEDVPLGNGVASLVFDEKTWAITLAELVTGQNDASASYYKCTLTGVSAYELRRFLARMSAAMDVAGFADLEPPE